MSDNPYGIKYHTFEDGEIPEWKDCEFDLPDDKTSVLVYPANDVLFRDGKWWHPVDGDYLPPKNSIKKWMYIPDPNISH